MKVVFYQRLGLRLSEHNRHASCDHVYNLQVTVLRLLINYCKGTKRFSCRFDRWKFISDEMTLHALSGNSTFRRLFTDFFSFSEAAGPLRYGSSRRGALGFRIIQSNPTPAFGLVRHPFITFVTRSSFCATWSRTYFWTTTFPVNSHPVSSCNL